MNTTEFISENSTERAEETPAESAEKADLTHVDEPGDTLATSHEEHDVVDLHCIGEIQLLILDDEPMICRAVQKALERKDFIIDAVSNPAEMEFQLRAKRYHAIILDYVIPGLHFDRIVGWLQDFQPNAGIIVVTGHPSVDSALNCLRARIFDYLTKPFQLADLKRVVMSCLESKGLMRMSEEALRVALGAAIRERRKASGLTLALMAQRANVSLGYLSQIELGKNSASVETLYRISLGLGVKMADLFRSIQIQA